MADTPFHDRFQGRVAGQSQPCAYGDCPEAGDFRAPNPYGRAASPNGPGDYLWLCLAHVRDFNARYDFFVGMSREEIEDAQMPAAGWANASRVFTDAGVDHPPKWRDFHDPIEAISARFKNRVAARAAEERDKINSISPQDRAAFGTLGLSVDADQKAVRAAYSALVRKYHPDRNGGDRSFEIKLQAVVEAYQRIKDRSAS
jgi:DnaJ-domain-containing protein 1